MGLNPKPTEVVPPLPHVRGQLELPIARVTEPDRNAALGGRSFYFFDFDGNIAFLGTPTFIFHKQTRAELALLESEYVKHHPTIGNSGLYADYRIDLDHQTGSYRHFRDQKLSWLKRLRGRKQRFIEDLELAVSPASSQNAEWRGPSWSCFYHATLNQRPLAMITARGHHPDTIREGFRVLVKRGLLPHEPNYLGIFPVSHPSVRNALGDTDHTFSIPELKRAAVRMAVETALERYGANPHHRFGMSDDDPHNVSWIVREMSSLKARYPKMSFFIIETQGGRLVKSEVYEDRLEGVLCANSQNPEALEQLTLW